MTYLSLLPVSRPLSINGMCYVMKTADIRIFSEISHHLTDDLALATIVRQRGGSIYQSSHPQWISTQVEDAPHYLRMMHRWYLFALLLLQQQTVACRLAIFLLHGWHPLMLWVLLAMAAFRPDGRTAALLGVVLLIRAGLSAGLQFRLFGRVLHRPLASLTSELLQPFHLLHALVDRRIRWRSRRYRVFASDRFQSDE